MTNKKDIYKNVVKAKELLQRFNEQEGGLDVANLFYETDADIAAMSAVLMSSSYNYCSGWSMPSTEASLSFYDEAKRRISERFGIPLRLDSFDQLTGQYEKIIFFWVEEDDYTEVSDIYCQSLGTKACDYAWVEGEWTHQDVLPLIQNLEKVLAEM